MLRNRRYLAKTRQCTREARRGLRVNPGLPSLMRSSNEWIPLTLTIVNAKF